MTRPTPAVTPMGVRDGDPASLAGLAQRRSGSVLDYARHACGESAAMDATAEAFARFRAAVAASDDPRDLAPDPLLLSCTRNSAAAMAPVPADRPGCVRTPFLLIGRYEGTNGAQDDAALAGHLATCTACADRAAAFDRAERAFRAPHPPVPEGAVVARVIAALEAAAPVVEVRASEETAPAGPDAPTAVHTLAVAAAAAIDEEAVHDGDTGVLAAVTAPAHEPEVAGVAEETDPFAAIEAGEDHELPPSASAGDVGRRVVLPVAIVTVGVVAAMAVAGVFGGTTPSPARGAAGPPAPKPPERPPAADTEVQSRAAREAREALERIERRELRTAREAEALRQRTATETDPESGTRSAPTTSSEPAATPRTGAAPEPSASPAPVDDGPANQGDGTGAEIESDPTGQGEPPADAPVFEPGTAPTP